MLEKRKRISFISILIITIFMLTSSLSVFANDVSLEHVTKKQKDTSEILSVIDDYQTKYFAIIKRNDMLLQWENNKILKEDRKDLDKLYKDVKKQVSNKYYLKKYKDIKKRYAKCDEVTTIGMNEFSERNYNDINKLLNEVYKAVQSQISPEDFESLSKNESKWMKYVEDYKNVLESMDYGTIGKLMYYDYQINMMEFRILLLMMYL